jgi:hypothetical protein
MEPDRVLTVLKLGIEVQESQGLAAFNIENFVKLVKDAEQRIHSDCCVVCRIAQVPQANCRRKEHHLAGKVLGQPNSPDTMTVCDRCHGYLSDHQRAWLLCCKDDATRFSCYFFGWADVFDLLYKLSGTTDFERFAEKFRCQGYYIRNTFGERRYVPSEREIIVPSMKRLKSC